MFIALALDTCSRDLNTDFTLGDYLYGAVNLTKNADPDKYRYSSYGIGFGARLQFSLSNGDLFFLIFFFFELIIVLLCMTIIEKRYFSSW